MSSIKHIREFINERLTAAAKEIFLEFEKMIIQYEEEINHQTKLLDFIWKPQTAGPNGHDSENLPVAPTSLNQEEQRPAQTEDNLEEINQNGEHLVLYDGTAMEVKYSQQHHENEKEALPDQKPLKENQDEPEPMVHMMEMDEQPVLKDESDMAVSSPTENHLVQVSEKTSVQSEEGTDPQPGPRVFIRIPQIKLHRISLQHHGRQNQEVPPQQLYHQTQVEPPPVKEELQEVPISEDEVEARDICYHDLFAKVEELTNLERSSGMEQDKALNPPTNEEGVPFLQDHESFTGTPNQMGRVKKPHVCKSCGKSFRHRRKLAVHMRSHKNQQTFSCKMCRKWFHQKTMLKDHMKMHKGEKTFPCTVCSKSFCRNRSLTDHMKIHTSEKPYSCPDCGKSFSSRRYLNKHKRTHTSEKPYSCSDCGKCFRVREALNKHKRIHTGEKPYSCFTCGRSFLYNCSLVAHMRTHTGERPFTCDLCEKCFALKTTLTVHRRIHTGELPYVCNICPKRFRRGHSLTVHMKSHAA